MSKAYSLDATEQYNQIVFEELKVGASRAADVGAFVSDRTEMRTSNNVPGLHGMLVEMYTSILSRKLVSDTYQTSKTIEVPATWSQHLKEAYAPQWILKRYPIKKRDIVVELSVQFTRYATYPKADVVVPKNMGPLVIRELVTSDIEVSK